MKTLKKIVLFSLMITFIASPLNVMAEPEEKPEEKQEEIKEEKPEEKEEEIKEEEIKEDKANEEKTENNESMKVDEDNEDPMLYEEKENEKVEDQSNREKEEIMKPIETPSSVTGEKYRGSGTVTDFTTTGSKAFYTVKGADNTVFYIVIDMDKTEDNVYFLSEINGEELSLGEVTSNTQKPIPEEKTKTKVDEDNEGSNLFLVLIIGLGAILFLGYYLIFGKLKNFNPLLNKKEEEEVEDLTDKAMPKREKDKDLGRVGDEEDES